MYQQPCPCGLALYTDCCQPLHLGLKTAQTAQQLMRSRYSAFVLQQIDYIVKTTALGQQAMLDVMALQQWSQENHWLKLEIIQTHEKLDKQHASVEFKAYYQQNGQNHIHHELSYFVQFKTNWYFLDPTLDQSLSMKQACICGSGKKFKQCCAHFL
ncbi:MULTISPECIES: YchJ family protein [unclassified Acinetobacter]|uniref:YchJ family protein n=1 Tax=unclassified Acinetobacter TaxID=196816 RepID=UPI0029352304|nr:MULTISPECIES: YchJ family protein [unclassified Acinetobacter]WOE30698.1 YchJ family protein [Acinetobacter sp. SAAs470]WOE38891.1 YchJ family protein [Acinetobacter sp. SAAs474]